MKILFVCTGNTCRSPMAEAIFNKLDNSGGYFAFSRGISVLMPQNLSVKSSEALKLFDITDYTHKSVMISAEDIESSDMVLTMTSAHKMALKGAFPKSKHKIYTLNEKAYGKDSDILDPYGLPQEEYNSCAKQIFDAVERILCTL